MMKKAIISCGSCGQKLRIPTDKRIEVTCPKCKKKAVVHISSYREKAINALKREDCGYASVENTGLNNTIDNTLVQTAKDTTQDTDYYGLKRMAILGVRLLLKSILR